MKKVYLLLIPILVYGTTWAQWTANTSVNTEVSSTDMGDAQTVTTSDGKTWVAYGKTVPAPNYYEMRAQLLDKNGVKLLGPEGMLVNNVQEASFTTLFAIAIDGNDNLIVAFTSNFNGTTYVNKVSPAGTQVWSPNGSPFPRAIVPKLCVLPNNDVIVSWLDQVAGTRAFMQRLAAADGSNVWPGNVPVLPNIGTHRTVPGHLLPLSGNGFIHVFHDRAVSFGISSILWAQRYDANGIAQWAAPIQLSNQTTAFNRNYSPAMHNDTLFLAYFGSTGFRFDSYLQRVNPDGTLPWGINGSDFATNNAIYEQDTKIAMIPSTNTVWTSCRVTDASQGLQGTYVQRFNKQTGARQLSDNAKVVYPITGTPFIVPLAISTFSDNSPVLMLEKYNSAISYFIYGSKLDNNGNTVWAGDPVALGTYVKDKLRMDMTKVVNDQAVAMWVETRNSVSQPYAQPIRIDGSTGLVPPVAGFTANNASVCFGSSVQFTSTSSGYISSYSWSFPGGTPSTSTLPNPVVTYNTNGVYNVSLTVTNAAGTNTSTQANYITVNGVIPTAMLNGNTSSCNGVANTFVVTGTGLGTAPIYTWKVNGITVPNGGSTFTFANLPGTYLIGCVVTSNALCAIPATVTTNTITYNIYPYTQVSLTASPTTNLYPGLFATISVTNANPAAVSYLWKKNGLLMPGVTGTSLTVGVDDIGSYTVSITDINGCSATSNNVLINQIDARKLFIYPSPNSGLFQVRYYSSAGDNTPRTLHVFDAKGALVYSKVYPINSSYERMDVDLRMAGAGIYFVEVRNNAGDRLARGKVLIN